MESDIVRGAISRVREKFGTDIKLLKEQKESLSEPYSKKYKAIEILKEMEEDLTGTVNNIEEYDHISIVLATIHQQIGILHSDTEELKAAEQRFMKCIELTSGKEKDPEAILPRLNALNQLGIIWSQWSVPNKAKKFLDEAEQIYKEYMAEPEGFKEPVSMERLFWIDSAEEELDSMKILEKRHTLTLFYLAQVYGALKDQHKSAVYCHMTLRRQLGNLDNMEDLDYVEWALNSATLSQYLMELNGFSETRHHLAAASYILKKYEDILKEKYKDTEESEIAKAEWERFNHRSADVAQCWAKYGILLMVLSRARLLEKAEKHEEDDEEDTVSNDNANSVCDLKFDVLEKEIEPIEKQVTDKYLLDFNDARLVFMNAQKWLNEAKTYYTLEDHASDHVGIVQDISRAYKYLAFFEEHEDRQAKMHKRRIDILEDVIKELNPQYYKAVCREIWLELGDTYSEIMDIKFDRWLLDSKPVPHVMAKVRNYSEHAIQNYQALIDSVENHKPDDPTQKLPEDLEDVVLHAYFRIGRLYYKVPGSDARIQNRNIQKAFMAYEYLIDYGKKYPKAVESMKEKYTLCQQLLNLLRPRI